MAEHWHCARRHSAARAADVAFTPHGPGHTMIGVRINHVNYFKGSVAQARFTDAALAQNQLLKIPK